MQYTIKTAAPSGDIVSVFQVASTMAERDATAGGTPFHEPMYRGRLAGYLRCLIEEVRSGRLQLCDSFGSPRVLDLGQIPQIEEIENDTVLTTCAWACKLKSLNEWAEKRGDSFVISHDGVRWGDERGSMVSTNQQEVQHPKGSDELSGMNAQKMEKKDRDPIPDLSEIAPNKWYGTEQAARFLGVSRKYLQNDLIPNGKLLAEKRGARYLVSGREILSYAEKYTQKS